MDTLVELRNRIIYHSGSTDLETIQTAIAGVKLSICRITTDPIGHVYEPAVVVVIQGRKRTVLGERIFDYGVGQYLVVPIELPIVSRIASANAEEPFLAIALTLRSTSIASLLLDAPTPQRNPAKFSGLAVGTASPELLDAMLRLICLLDSPADIPILMPGLEREILWRLLSDEHGSLVRQIGSVGGRLSEIGHALRWLRSRYADIIRIEEMADQAGMSVSTFHRHFRAITAMTPIQYQKQVRLQEARMRLLAGAGDVASVRFAVGYDSPSQFSREYTRLFGFPPGRDASRLREIPPRN